MSSLRSKLLVSGLTTAVCGVGAWQFLEYRRSHPPLTIIDDTQELYAYLVERQDEAPPRPAAEGSSLVREDVSEEEALRLYPQAARYAYDPHTYYRYQSGLDVTQEWPDHDDGRFRRFTNSLGLREDNEIPDETDLFVVVAGDSHTDGLCNNRESFANRLEAALEQRNPGASIEVLNTGLSGYSFYNYLGALERFLDREPQAFVVAFYGGNDFLDMLRPWHFFQRTAPPPQTRAYWRKIGEAGNVSSSALALALNQLLYFEYYPDQVEVALEATRQVTAEIQRVCRENEIELFYVYIPNGFDVDGALTPPIERAREVLDLSDASLRQYNLLADKLIAFARDSGIPVVDLREHYQPELAPFYWNDLHINVRGHQMIADLLLPMIEATCPIGH